MGKTIAHVCRSAGTVLLIASAANAAPPDKICEQLKSVVADAPNSFAAFKGALARQEKSSVEPYDIVDYYAAKVLFDGATSCEIDMRDTPTSYGQSYPNYSCNFPFIGTNKGVATKKLATRVAACLPGISHPSGPGLSKDSGMLTAHSKDYSMSYSFISGPASETISFSIQSDNK
jgi:hypothetical protein